jgi:putative flavoprotein involved in K+ transport
VAATGAFQRPVIPTIVSSEADVLQIHSNDYRNPSQLPEGGVLVVGAGSSGSQIAAELNKSGKEVCLSIGPHQRPPRRYRGRDFVWWLGVLGQWDAPAPEQGAEHVTICVSGADGGATVDFRDLASKGVKLLGRTISYRNGALTFANDLAGNIAAGDRNYLELLKDADRYVRENGIDLPEETSAHDIGPLPLCATKPTLRLDLEAANISAIVWATGFAFDFGWLKAGDYREDGSPIHKRGVSNVPGVYFLGLPWQSRRASSFIWGVWHDASYIADQILIQKSITNTRRDPNAVQLS